MTKNITERDFLKIPMSISHCGQYFANASLTGQLNVWDTLTNNLIAQYVPSSHLSTSCTKISWPTNRHWHQKKEIQIIDTSHNNLSNINDELKKLILLAMGTENGTIFLFSVLKNEIYSVLKDDDGHKERINDIYWLPEEDSIFSCSNDNFVIEWSISEVKVKCKTMLLDHSVITSICALNRENLITGSNLLKWWNWPQKQLLKTFSGHANEIQFLRPLFFQDYKDSLYSSQIYLISSAISDRYINLWKLDCKNRDSNECLNSLASFVMDEEPISLEIAYNNSLNVIFILSVSKNGYFYLFKHLIEENSQSSTPITHKFRLEIQTQINSDKDMMNGELTPKNKWKRAKLDRSIPFLYAHIEQSQLLKEEISKTNHQKNMKISFIYGNVNCPIFEQMAIQECEKLCQSSNQGVIIKDSSILKSMDLLPRPKIIDQITNIKIKSAKSSDKTTVIGPAGIVAHQPLFNNINGLTNGGEEIIGDDIKIEDLNNKFKKKVDASKDENETKNCNDQKSENKSDELTLDEQLKLLEKPKTKENQQIKEELSSSSKESSRRKNISNQESTDCSGNFSESMVNILIQGLQSKDANMLSTVLQKDNSDTVVTNTVKKLPIEHVSKLLMELEKGLCQNGQHHSIYLKWITLLLRHKITYLMTIPNISEEFLPLNQLLQARTSMLEKCYQLKGRLDLILTQIKNEFKNEKLSFKPPKFTYESESSESSESENDDNDDDDDIVEEEEDSEMSIDDNDLIESNDDDDDDDDYYDDEISEHEDSEEDINKHKIHQIKKFKTDQNMEIENENGSDDD